MTTLPATAFIRPRVAAGVLFLDDSDRVLLVVPSYKDFLDIPGGYVEPGESPSVGARREVREELSIEPEIGQLLVADWLQDSTDSVGGAKLLFVFDGGRLSSSQLDLIKVDGDEIMDYGFYSITELGDVTIPRLANRIEHAVAAYQDRTTRYLEDGHLVTSLPTT